MRLLKTFFAFAFVATMTTSVRAVEYDIRIGDTQITSENANNITYYGLRSGHISFDASTYTLTLDNVDMEGGSFSINGYGGETIYQLTINLIGENKLKTFENAFYVWEIWEDLWNSSSPLELTFTSADGMGSLTTYMVDEDNTIWDSNDEDDIDETVYAWKVAGLWVLIGAKSMTVDNCTVKCGMIDCSDNSTLTVTNGATVEANSFRFRHTVYGEGIVNKRRHEGRLVIGPADGTEPVIAASDEEQETNFSEDMVDENGDPIDLSDTVIDGIYYELMEWMQNGFDPSEGCIVFNDCLYEDLVEEVVTGDFRSMAMLNNYQGLVVQVEGKGKIEVDCQTLGGFRLTVRIGTGDPVQYEQGERGTIQIGFDVSEPTYIYVYNSYASSLSSSRRKVGAVVADEYNSLKIYGVKIIPSANVSVTISDAGMATFSSSSALDFSGVEGLKAYIVSEFVPETKALMLQSVDAAKANTGLLLVGEAGSYEIPVTDEANDVTNLLVPISEDIVLQPTETIDGVDYTNFVLTRHNGNVGFYRFDTAQSYSAGKAYLQIKTSLVEEANTSGVVTFNMIFDDDATGINDLKDLKDSKDLIFKQGSTIVNLAGQRLTKIQKGINILKGKKVFVY